MSKLAVGLIVGLLAASFALDAEAQRRLGGGRNIGKQSPQVQQRQAQPTQSATTPAQTPQTAPGAVAPTAAAAAGAATTAARSPMRNMLIGAAAGLGLMALASYLGFGETMATIMLFVLIGFGILMVIGFIMRRRMGQPALQGAGGGVTMPPQHMDPQTLPRRSVESSGGVRPGSAMDHFLRGGAVNPDTPWGIPAGFDAAGFVANARTYFDKLQEAWRTGNLDELSDFTTNDMFIALTHELRARGDAPKSIAIDVMDTRLLGLESTTTEHVASVRFTGVLHIDGEREMVDEVWNLAKAADGKTGWLLAGIQQIT